jgi:hypothetical protein
MNKLLLLCNNVLLQNYRLPKNKTVKYICDVIYYAKQLIYCRVDTIYDKVDGIYFSSSTIPSCEVVSFTVTIHAPLGARAYP